MDRISDWIALRGATIEPDSFDQRILLTVAGLTPQIITETVYALAVNRKPPFVPTRIVVLTTSEGANRVRLMLQGSDPGWLGRLGEEYGIPSMELSQHDVLTLQTDAGLPLGDIRTDADNTYAADLITETVRALTADEDFALHVSIAGGRKTLGFFAGYALSLDGARKTDCRTSWCRRRSRRILGVRLPVAPSSHHLRAAARQRTARRGCGRGDARRHSVCADAPRPPGGAARGPRELP